MLAAMGAHRLAVMHRPAQVTAHHQRIREIAATAPRQIHGWVGQDIKVPAQAISVLDPNAIISRRYINLENGNSAGFLLVHCSDAHDMAGHFPLRCYPADGWLRRGSEPRDWQVGDLLVTGTEYQFYRSEGVGQSKSEQTIVVANFLLRPNGKVLRDMNAMAASIVGAGGQRSGAGQVQVYFDAAISREQRDQAIVTLIEGYRPIIDAMLQPAESAPQG
jgi:hypothetical protein